jgi:hypothetical protein
MMARADAALDDALTHIEVSYDASMRTTLTLDDALLEELRTIAHRDCVPFKQVVDRAIRIGLRQMESAPRRRRYCTPTESMGIPNASALVESLALADAFEDDEIARKLAVGK